MGMAPQKLRFRGIGPRRLEGLMAKGTGLSFGASLYGEWEVA
ncbi:hypothetical protein GCM10020370_47370 [Paenibacillus hodogayensis]